MLLDLRFVIIPLFAVCVVVTRCGEDAASVHNQPENVFQENSRKSPTILIVTLIRNKAHTLPYFLSYLEGLNYPKHRLALWIRSDHNEDNTLEILRTWLNRTANFYHSCDFQYDAFVGGHRNETSITDWPEERFKHIIRLKNEAMLVAQQMWADFIFFLDADVFLTDPNTLTRLTTYDVPIISPMLRSDGLYSNYWCGMSDDYYYQRTDEYREIYEYKKTGNFPVPMVHSAVLVNLNEIRSEQLTFDKDVLLVNQRRVNYSKLYDGPIDDIIIFAISANTAELEMIVSNEYYYGYLLPPLDKDESFERDYQQLINIKLNIINDLAEGLIAIHADFEKYITYPEKDRITLDHIYMINLLRRPERRIKMENGFKELGLDVEHIPAVDGRELNLDIIEKMGIRFLSGYEDPYNHRQMTMGEIGCFLSHYKIWEKIVELNLKEVLILEDDIRFEPYFKRKAINLLEEARNLGEWDLIYFGRKRLVDQAEPYVEGTDNLVYVGYSYWTLGYAITLTGAKKLLAVDPLRKLIPVDEFLPVMFNRHPNKTWSQSFEPRNLIAYSAAPLILYPTHYTGDDGYISDTEDSELTPTDNFTTGVGSTAQLKSDKGRENFSNSLMDDDEINKNHKASSLFMGEIRGGDDRKHDGSEL